MRPSLSLRQADMHGLLTFVLIPSTQSKPPPVKENVVSRSGAPVKYYTSKRGLEMRLCVASARPSPVSQRSSVTSVSPPDSREGTFRL